jgi:uncharacterized surface anchored protein
MKARTHTGSEKRVKTSSSNETVSVEKGKQKGLNAEGKANRELGKAGLTVDDVAEQSAYESDRTNIAHQAAASDRDKKA